MCLREAPQTKYELANEDFRREAVRKRTETVHVATKIPPKDLTWPARAGSHPDEAFPGDHIRACTERSLRHLGTDVIDVQQFHVWHDDWLEQGDTSVEPAERKAAYKKALARIADEVYSVPLYSLPVYYAFTKDLDFRAYPDELPRFWEYKWK